MPGSFDGFCSLSRENGKLRDKRSIFEGTCKSRIEKLIIIFFRRIFAVTLFENDYSYFIVGILLAHTSGSNSAMRDRFCVTCIIYSSLTNYFHNDKEALSLGYKMVFVRERTWSSQIFIHFCFTYEKNDCNVFVENYYFMR